MQVALVLLVVAGLGAPPAAGRSLQRPTSSSQAGRSLLSHQQQLHLLSAQENPFDVSSVLKDTNRQAKQQLAAQHIHEAVQQASGSAGATGHATAAATRDGADVQGGALAHTDRHRKRLLLFGAQDSLATSSKRVLRGAQENVLAGSLNIQDSKRQASAADARSRIKAAVEAGATLQVTSAAGFGSDLPLRRLQRMLHQEAGGAGIGSRDSLKPGVAAASGRALLQGADGSGIGGGDSFRAVQHQERVFTSTLMIRKAVEGQLDVADAIATAQAPMSKGIMISAVAEARAAGAADAAPASRVLP